MPETSRLTLSPVIRLAKWVTVKLERLDARMERLPLFWHPIWVRKGAPPYHRWPTQEYEWPYRVSNSHIFRLPGRRGLVVGWWHGGGLDEESQEFEDHLGASLQSHKLITIQGDQESTTRMTHSGLDLDLDEMHDRIADERHCGNCAGGLVHVEDCTCGAPEGRRHLKYCRSVPCPYGCLDARVYA